MSRRTTGLLAAATLLLVTTTPDATAAETPAGEFCADDAGVSLAVDFGDLGGGVKRECVDESGPAAAVFDAAGIDLTPVAPFPGAVCQVEGEPADVPCGAMPAADAYWGLYVAEAGGAWDFAPVGLDQLELADGDFVAFAWQGSPEPAPPSVDPVAGEPADAPQTTDAEESEPAAGVPGWVVVVAALALVGLAGLVVVVRRGRAQD